MSLFGKNQGSQKPTAFGTLISANSYGQVIPKIYGMTQSPWLPIWAANLRTGAGPGQKKFKLFKKGVQNYIENIDGILGHNPIRGINQVFVNGTLFPTAPYPTISAGGVSPYDINHLTAESLWWYNAIETPHMLCVMAVTCPVAYSFAVNDYGGPGPQTLSGRWEIPLWNELEQGPDPTNNSAYRNYPYCYRWRPRYETLVFIDVNNSPFHGFPGPAYNFYVIELLPATNEQPPINALGLTFENELGSGPEFGDAPSPFDEQQIIYPMYAGMGSSDIDLGASGSLPQIQPEVMGKWGIYPTGDGDFVDMIEDTIKSGIAQAAIGSETAFTQQETGLSSYSYPGVVQLKWNTDVEAGAYGGVAFNLPNTPGNFLLCIAITAGSGSPPLTPVSTNGETWTAVFPGTPIYQVFYAIANGGDPGFNGNGVFLSGWGSDWTQIIAEVSGLDLLDAVAYSTSSYSASVVSTVQQGLPGYLLAIPYIPADTTSPNLDVFGWNLLTPPNQYGFSPAPLFIQEKVITTPGTYTITEPAGGVPSSIALFSFKSSQARNYPKPLGDFMDLPSLDLVRQQCRANGLWGSLTMTSQSAASDWLKTLYQAANAAPVFLGSKLYSIPYSEVSYAGNGCLYTPPTASGPIANLSDINGDFVATPKKTTASRIDMPNVLQMQIISREANYAQTVVAQPDSASIALYGVRKADPIVNNAIQDASIARALLGIMVRRNQYGGDTWEFTLTAKWMLLSPMDLVTITDSLQGISQVPVRLTSIAEQSDGSYECEAEPFVYGMCAPSALTTTTPAPNPTDTDITAGDVNAPIIFEPVPGLYPGYAGDQIWVVVSSNNPNYGGCIIYVSTDGGASFVLAGDPVIGSAVTGFITAEWPAAADPDSTNNLSLDLSESNGALSNFNTVDENNFTYPCYVQGGNIAMEVNGVPIASATPLLIEVNDVDEANMATLEVNGTAVAETATAAFDYELMTYAIATLTGPYTYELMATGSGNFLRRAVFGAPDAGEGVDHPAGSRFAFLSPAGTGILKLQMPTAYIGQTLFFKIVSFNQFGSGQQNLDDETVATYSYTPTGIPGTV
jgi:hypothetical protein